MSLTLPRFITFTGADARTPIHALKSIHERYPVEWGVLFSKSRQGKANRYPAPHNAQNLLTSGMITAAHLCGEYARDIMEYQSIHPWSFPINGATRVQINHAQPTVAAAQRFSQMFGKRCILQCRDTETFPREHDVDWLYDASGGRGLHPDFWPPHPGKLVGYAGGINPDNVLDTIVRINGLMGSTGAYWLDMESGVRDADDWFDLVKVRKVCELVYGERP